MPQYMIKFCTPHKFPYITFINAPIIPQRIRFYLSENGFHPYTYTQLHDYLTEIIDERACIHLPDFYGENGLGWDNIKARIYLSKYTLFAVRHILAHIESEQDMERQRRWAARHVDGKPLDPSEDNNSAADISPGFEDKLIDWLHFSSIISTLTPQQQELLFDCVILGVSHNQIARFEKVTHRAITQRISSIRKRIHRKLESFKEEDERL